MDLALLVSDVLEGGSGDSRGSSDSESGLSDLAHLADKILVYFGLLIFLGDMVYGTQAIIERVNCGDMDYIKNTLTLFTDFITVLVRIFIMPKNAGVKNISYHHHHIY